MRPRRTRTAVIASAVAVGAAVGTAPAAQAQVQAQVQAQAVSATYRVTGVAHIEASGSRVAVHRTILTARFAPDGRLTGTLPVPPSRAHFSVGTTPAVATVSFEEVGRLTGSQFPTASGTALTGTARYVVRLSDFTLGDVPLDLGPDCRTITPVTMTASTPPRGTWDPTSGGRVVGTFTIGGFETCNGLERAIDSTISGSGNEIRLRLGAPTG